MYIIKRASYFVVLAMGCCTSFAQAMQDEYYTVLNDLNIQSLEKVVGNDQEIDYVLVEKIPFEQLDLSLLNDKQHEQKQEKYGKGKLFFYETDLIPEVFKNFAGIKSCGIRSLFRYEPSQKNNKFKPTALFIIHGTYGEKNEGYFDYTTDQFKGFVRYATEKAEKEGRVVDIFSFRWSGENSDKARILAGIFLGFLLNTIKESYGDFDIVGFSHGCNLALVAANILIDGYKIREFIALAPPILEDSWFYAPHNITYFFPIMSKGDFVVTLGRFYSTSFNASCDQWKNLCQKSCIKESFDKQGKLYKNPCERDGRVINIHYTHNNEHPSHSQVPLFIANILADLMERVYGGFVYDPCIRNLSVNWVPQELCKTYQVEPLNISLYAQNSEEKLVYEKKLRIETLNDSLRYEKEHEKAYLRPKNQPDSYIYTFYNKMRNLFK